MAVVMVVAMVVAITVAEDKGVLTIYFKRGGKGEEVSCRIFDDY
jgi:hypothetical protein